VSEGVPEHCTGLREFFGLLHNLLMIFSMVSAVDQNFCDLCDLLAFGNGL
jgi:hypothetical protein